MATSGNRRSASPRRTARRRAGAGDGFPTFRHGQWTVEGEIERWGALAQGTRGRPALKRAVVIVLVVALILPLAVATVIAVAGR